jgi:hypothetical protein
MADAGHVSSDRIPRCYRIAGLRIAGGSAYYRGTLTLDDGRTATLAVRRFGWVGSTANGHRGARVRCRGDACFTPTAILGLYYHPIEYNVSFEVVDIPTGPHGNYICGTEDPGLGVPRSCRIASRVSCVFRNFDTPRLPPQEVTTGMLKLHRTAPSCRGVSSRVPPGSGAP